MTIYENRRVTLVAQLHLAARVATLRLQDPGAEGGAMHRYRISAHNYAHDSENPIHDDDVASRHGFEGGLVPGAADFAYLSRAVFEAWGEPWPRGGTMEAKFVKPLYHGELATAEARVGEHPNRLELALLNSRDTVCAVGNATRESGRAPPRIADYPRHEPLRGNGLAEPAPASLPVGHPLGAVEYTHDADAALAESRTLFVEAWHSPSGEARWHPALCLHYANRAVRENIRLGPWVHTASRVHYFDEPADGDAVSLRGSVARSYEKRGHVMVEADLAMFANAERPLVQILHTAIVRLAAS